MKHEIEIPDLPEGWEPVAYRYGYKGETGFDKELFTIDMEKTDYPLIIVRKKQPRRGLHDPLRFAEGLIEQLPDDHEGAINWLMNHGDGDKADKLRKKYSAPLPRRIVLEETDIKNAKIAFFDDAGMWTYWEIVECEKCAE